MSNRKNKKISIDAGEHFAANPFAAIDASSLPAGEIKSKQPAAHQKTEAKKSKGRVEVRREKAGRGGKTVTTLKEFPMHIPLTTLEKLTLEFKKTCACGGTLKGRVVELQGDVCDKVCSELAARGYQAVRAGG